MKQLKVIMSTNLLRRPSQSIGLLTVLALLAGMFVVVAAPVEAADPKPDYLPTFEACPESVVSGTIFNDVSSRHPNVEDINCIAYYGITKGKSAARYAPDDPVNREHMALFLIRMAKLVEIDVPGPGARAFNDIGNLTQESQDAISQLAQLGITLGVGNNNYAPARNVSRGEMALFLSRLMNLMDVPEHRGDVFGYLPADVEDRVLDDATVDAPYTDMRQRTVAEFDAVEQLYELGVASGVSSRAYGPARDMSRSHMAEFMAAILDHSNLRPAGVNVQLTPSVGWESYTVTAMISARADDFTPLVNDRVDWFYTADPNRGLQDNGECDLDTIIEGDCVWDDDRDDLTDDNGNYFETFNAEAGEVVTFIAWMGSRDGETFDARRSYYGLAEAVSDKGPARFVITSDIEEDAGRIDADHTVFGDAWIVDRDVQRSVRLTIQLEDEDGRILNREGLEIAVEVKEWDGSVITTAVDGDNKPAPDISGLDSNADQTDDDITILTNQRGEATYQVSRPRGEGGTVVTFTYEDGLENDGFAVVWSDDPPAVFTAKPDFDTYQSRSSSRISFGIDYDLYDQYGKRLTRRSSTTGRAGTLAHTLNYTVYKVEPDGSSATGEDSEEDLGMTLSSSGRVSYNLNTGNASQIDLTLTGDEAGTNYVVVVKPSIKTDEDNVEYAGDAVVVWIIEDADDETDLDKYKMANYTAFLANIDEVDDTTEFTSVAVDTVRDEFRTFFTIWEYDSNDTFVDGHDDEDLTISQFEAILAADEGVGVNDLDIRLYSPNSSRFSYFIVTPP